MLCAAGCPYAVPIGLSQLCVCWDAIASVQDLGASDCRANLFAAVGPILAVDRNRIKQSLSVSVDPIAARSLGKGDEM
jgi:hypothetical protein